jgi:hypothetical protein
MNEENQYSTLTVRVRRIPLLCRPTRRSTGARVARSFDLNVDSTLMLIAAPNQL